MKTKTQQVIKFITMTAVIAALYAIIFPIISNAFIIGWELTYFGVPFWFSAGYIALGEAIVLIAGYFLFFLLRKRPNFYHLVDATQHIDFKW